MSGIWCPIASVGGDVLGIGGDRTANVGRSIAHVDGLTARSMPAIGTITCPAAAGPVEPVCAYELPGRSSVLPLDEQHHSDERGMDHHEYALPRTS
jgi:hypothetical protein